MRLVVAAAFFLYMQPPSETAAPPQPTPPEAGDPTGYRDRLTRRSFTIEVADGVAVTRLLARRTGASPWFNAKADLYDGRYYAELPEIMIGEFEMACEFDLLLVLARKREIERHNVDVCTLDQWHIGVEGDEMSRADKSY